MPHPFARAVMTAIFLLPFFAHAADCIDPPPDPTNTYDAQHTYTKLIGRYPYIKIASDALPPGVTKVAGQTYVQYGTRCLKLDLYLPPTASVAHPAPVVVIVHGGGWHAGFRSEFVPMAVRLAQRGYASATISYRLSGEALYPAAIHDTRAAIRWVRAHAADYRIDPQRIAVAGGSAGGQIASLAGVTGHLDRFDPQAASSSVPGSVQAIVNIDGLSDFTTPLALKNEDDPKKNPSAAGAWFGGRYADKTAAWHEASPINYVRPGMPPILFVDSAQPRYSSGRAEMIAKMNAAGVANSVLEIRDTPHSFWLFDPWLQPTVDAMVDFLDREMPQR